MKSSKGKREKKAQKLPSHNFVKKKKKYLRFNDLLHENSAEFGEGAALSFKKELLELHHLDCY